MAKTIRVHLFADPIDFDQTKEYASERLRVAAEAYRLRRGEGVEFEFTASSEPDYPERAFDLLLFDYGGIGIAGGGVLQEHTTLKLLQHAEEHPSRTYVLVSAFTRQAAVEFAADAGQEIPANVHLDVEEFFRDFAEGRIVLV